MTKEMSTVEARLLRLQGRIRTPLGNSLDSMVFVFIVWQKKKTDFTLPEDLNRTAHRSVVLICLVNDILTQDRIQAMAWMLFTLIQFYHKTERYEKNMSLISNEVLESSKMMQL